MAGTVLCKVVELAPDSMLECDAGGGRKVCVARSGDAFFAFQAECPHQELAMCDGSIDGNVVTCLGHLWQWDARTGEPQGLAEQPLTVYRLRREGDAILLDE